MRWAKRNTYYSDSHAGYRICVCRVNGAPVYVAWAPESRSVAIGYFSGEQGVRMAVDACELHYKSNSSGEVKHAGRQKAG